ncbi:MAG TPA: DHHA1 domain-containing protein, partial [Bacteroidia bacterium]|nr:DHHA1 domain-containing protein [Bacteroidia bacterium]
KAKAVDNALMEKIELRRQQLSKLLEQLENFSPTESDSKAEAKQILKGKSGKASLKQEEETLQIKIEKLTNEIAHAIKNELLKKVKDVNGINFLAEKIEISNADSVKRISFDLKNEVKNLFCLLTAEIDGKPHLSLIISENLVKEKNLDASKIISELAKEIQGGGGGQPFYATAGGKNVSGLTKVIEKSNALFTDV